MLPGEREGSERKKSSTHSAECTEAYKPQQPYRYDDKKQKERNKAVKEFICLIITALCFVIQTQRPECLNESIYIPLLSILNG